MRAVNPAPHARAGPPEQAAEYWSALAERVEQSEGKQPGRTALYLPRPSEVTLSAMPVFGCLLSVGIALFLGLLAVSAQFEARHRRGGGLNGSEHCGAVSAKSY